MDRNRVFMLSYIAFIILSIIVRVFWKFPMWNNLVAAVTCASFFFAFADINYSLYNFNLVLLSDYKAETTQQIEHADNLRLFAEFVQKCQLIPQDKDFLAECVDSAKDIIHDLETRKSIYDKLIEKRNLNIILASIFLFLGFLLFFCVLAFNPITEYCMQCQDVITMIVFATVLSSPFIDEYNKKRNAKLLDKTKETTKRILKIEKNFKKGMMNYAN